MIVWHSTTSSTGDFGVPFQTRKEVKKTCKRRGATLSEARKKANWCFSCCEGFEFRSSQTGSTCIAKNKRQLPKKRLLWQNQRILGRFDWWWEDKDSWAQVEGICMHLPWFSIFPSFVKASGHKPGTTMYNARVNRSFFFGTPLVYVWIDGLIGIWPPTLKTTKHLRRT